MATHRIPGHYEYEEDFVLTDQLFPRDTIDQVKNFEMHEGDVAIVTYPKSGTTWMQEILYQVQTGGDIGSSESRTNVSTRVPMLEMRYSQPSPGGPATGMERVESTERPHLMHSHCPARFFSKQLLGGKAKFIVVMRNLKDNLVSFYYFYKGAYIFGFGDGTWEEFFGLFKSRQLMYGDWLDFNLSWWEHRDNACVLILKYEDMKRKPKESIQKVAEFVGKDLSEDQLQRITEHTSFESMRHNDAVNHSKRRDLYSSDAVPFMRKGIVGSWVSHFTKEQNDYVENNHIKEAEKRGLVFEYEL